MSLIDILEQSTLAKVMRDIELYEKSGRLIVRQGSRWVELSFHQGSLMCIGPIRTHESLGERLLAAGIISRQALQEMVAAIGDGTQSEARIARTLVELKHVSREVLRTWAVERVVEAIQPLLSWSPCELSFDENAPLPSDRLFVKIMPSSLLAKPEQIVQQPSQATLPVASDTFTVVPEVAVTSRTSLPPIMMNSNAGSVPSVQEAQSVQSLSSTQVVQPAASAPNAHVGVTNVPRVDIAKVPTLMDSSQFFSNDVSMPLLRSTDPLHAVKSSGSAKIPSFTATSPASSEKQAASSLHFTGQETSGSTFPTTLDMPSTNFPNLLDEQDIVSASFFKSLNEQDVSSPSFALRFNEQEEHMVAQPKPVLSAASMHVDTSFMTQDMVLVPLDMEQLAAQELDIQITPPQWQLLIRADGRTPLSKICADLRLYPQYVCQIAGELMILGIVQVIPTQMGTMVTPQMREIYISGIYNAPMPLNAPLPSTPQLGTPNADVQSSFNSMPSFDVQSQGGNRGNSTTFGPGVVWGTPMPSQPSSSSGPMMVTHGSYTPVGGKR